MELACFAAWGQIYAQLFGHKASQCVDMYLAGVFTSGYLTKSVQLEVISYCIGHSKLLLWMNTDIGL